MRLTGTDSPLDGVDFPATSDDIAALERVKKFDHLDPQQYLEFLLLFTKQHPPTREIPERHEPFEL